MKIELTAVEVQSAVADHLQRNGIKVSTDDIRIMYKGDGHFIAEADCPLFVELFEPIDFTEMSVSEALPRSPGVPR